MNPRRVSLREDVTRQPATPLKVDREKGVVYGVRLLGLVSENGRDYDPQAVRRAVERGLYEGAKCNINHPAAPDQPTAYQSRFGRFRQVTFEDGFGARGNLHYNPEHAEARSFAWWCENDAQAVGFSHNAGGDLEERDGRPRVTDIAEVHSVDLVADPATTGGIFEHKEPAVKTTLKKLIEAKGGRWSALLTEMDAAMMDTATEEAGGDWKASLTDAIAALVREGSEESHKLATKIMKLLKNKGADVADDTAMESLKARLTAAETQLTESRAKIDAYEVKDRLAAKRATADRLCDEARLPKEARTDLFVETLLGAKDDAAMKALVEDRAKIARGAGRPVSAPPGGALDEAGLRKHFAEALNSN